MIVAFVFDSIAIWYYDQCMVLQYYSGVSDTTRESCYRSLKEARDYINKENTIYDDGAE